MSNSTENYKGVFEERLGYGKKPALILVDFVQAYFDPECELFADVEPELASALRVRAAARNAGIPVVLTNVEYHASMVNSGVFGKKARPLRNFKSGSNMGRWPDGLEPFDDELIISKQYPSAFFGTSLSSTLTANGIDSVILTGLTTSGCIRATCVDASSHGFIPIVVREACGDRASYPHEANLFDMNAKYADVVSEKDVVDYLDALDQIPAL